MYAIIDGNCSTFLVLSWSEINTRGFRFPKYVSDLNITVIKDTLSINK